MYACLCHAVTVDEVRSEISAGASSEAEVAERTYAGTGCGSCVMRICALLREADPQHGQRLAQLAS